VEPDLVALQEVTAASEGRWRAALRGLGLPHVVCSLERAQPDRQPAGPRRAGVLLASRGPVRAHDPPTIGVPWPESVLSVLSCGIDVHVAHVPNARNGWIKPQTCRAIHDALARPRRLPQLLCGDFNTPRRETPAGEVVTFARDRYGRLRPERGEEWDEAELGILTGLAPHGFRDAFRSLHGYGAREISWAWPRFPRSGYRLDHVLVKGLEPTACGYLHELRTSGLSDHSAIVCDVR
jgi:endonuclease/exonuclease/phosphatase family metal-dependent hydrolase